MRVKTLRRLGALGPKRTSSTFCTFCTILASPLQLDLVLGASPCCLQRLALDATSPKHFSKHRNRVLVESWHLSKRSWLGSRGQRRTRQLWVQGAQAPR